MTTRRASRRIRATARRSLAALAVGCAAIAGGNAFALSILLPTDRSLPPMELVRHDQTVAIRDQVAKISIHQVFHNPTPRPLEAIYLFPIPKGAQVTDVALTINGEKVHGEVLERDKARGVYEDIVRRMRDPMLVEFMENNLLRVRIFPVPASGDQEVDLELTQVLPGEGGLVKYEFPFAADPGKTGAATDLRDARLDVTIESSHGIANVYSPTHPVKVNVDKDGKKATVAVDAEAARKHRDFTLYYSTAEKEVGVNLVAYRPKTNDSGWFLLMVSPRRDVKESEVQPKDVTFVLDTSGSMSRDRKLDQAKESLIQCLAGLGDKDRFNIIEFATEVEPLSETFLDNTAEARQSAEAFIKKLKPRGSTNIQGALRKALESPAGDGAKSKRLHVVVFLTDGQPTVGETLPNMIVRDVQDRNDAGLRIFTFGLGYDVNTRLLDDIADATRAVADYVKPDENIEQKVTTFFDKVSAPVLTQCELKIEGADVAEMYPKELPDLFEGQQVVVAGRYRKPGPARIVLKGNEGDKKATFDFETTFPERETETDFIETLWGTRKIGYLLDEIRRNGESKEVVDEVVELARKYNVVTPYTSYLVTEDGAMPEVAGARRGFGPTIGAIPDVQISPGQPQPGRPIYRYSEALVLRDYVGGPTPAPTAHGAPGTTGGSRSISTGLESFSMTAPDAGAGAVNRSVAIRQMKEKDAVAPLTGEALLQTENGLNLRKVGDRTFVDRDGAWIDRAAEEATQPAPPRVKVQFGSTAYFELFDLRPDLKPALVIGDRVTIRLEKVILEIDRAGLETLGETERNLLKH